MTIQNIMFPQLGAAGTFYARSVNATVLRQGALPDPALVYDSVMKRTEYKKHPNNVSSVLWYWASIIIHGRRRSQGYFRHAMLTILQISSGRTTAT
jgi:hypothetical protein